MLQNQKKPLYIVNIIEIKLIYKYDSDPFIDIFEIKQIQKLIT